MKEMDAEEDKALERGAGTNFLSASVAGCISQGSAVLIKQSSMVLMPSLSQDDLVQAPSPFCS